MRFLPAQNTPKDDRGVSLSSHHLTNRLGEVSARYEARSRVLMVVGCVMGGLLIAYQTGSGFHWDRSTWTALGITIPAMIACAWLAKHIRNPRVDRTTTAWLSAYRKCGACAYSLADVEPGRDGVAVCPECGAAWHSDRWTMSGLDPKGNGDLLQLLEGHTRNLRMHLDDRGIPRFLPKRWYPIWVDNEFADAKARAALKKAMKWIGVRRILIIIGLGAVGIGVGLWAMRRAGIMNPGEETTAAGGMAIAVLAVVWWSFYQIPSARSIRRAALAAGACPNCGERFGEQPPGFDGCVACRPCGRAWKLDER